MKSYQWGGLTLGCSWYYKSLEKRPLEKGDEISVEWVLLSYCSNTSNHKRGPVDQGSDFQERGLLSVASASAREGRWTSSKTAERSWKLESFAATGLNSFVRGILIGVANKRVTMYFLSSPFGVSLLLVAPKRKPSNSGEICFS